MMAARPGETPGHWRRWLWGAAAALFLAPAAAMQITRDISWGPGDFLVFGLLLLGACGALELVMRIGRTARSRWAGGLLVVGLALLLWIELAVGIVGPG
jgi:peptidoglycan/LPS O-acetylase OafA/YrhL